MLNPFFLQGSQSEQRLVQELINEQLRMYGVDVTYIPRKIVNRDTILNEVETSKFDDNYTVEAYVNTYEGHSGAGDILTKFGMSLRDELTITISKERFDDFIAMFLEGESDDEIIVSGRPREGDLIYFPLGQRLFEVKFVEHEDPFYQLGKNYVYQLKCELFEYEDEVIDTSIDEIDTQVQDEGYITTLKLTGIGETASVSPVINTGYVREVFLNNDGSGYTSAPIIQFDDSPVSGGTATAVAITTSVGGVRSIKEILLTNAGFGYTSAPGITIYSGGGVGAAATASIETTDKGVVSFALINGGSAYPAVPTITVAHPSQGATATAVVGASGTITSLTITNPGTQYLSAPTVTISDPNRSGSISSFRLNNDGRKNGDVYTVVNDSTSGFAGSSGEDYEVGDILTLHPNNVGMGGTEALIRIDAVKAGTGSVQGFTMIYGGYDYEDVNATRPNGGNHNPSNDYYNGVNVSGSMNGDNFKLTAELVENVGVGTTALATALLNNSGIVTGITLTNAGGGYTKGPHVNAPVVTIDNDDSIKSGVRAIARAEISEGNVVTAVRIVNPGIGYTENPTVTVADPPAISGIGTYQFNELITGESSRTTARVKEWIPASNTLKISYVDGTFTNGELIVGAASSATYAADFYTNDDTYDKYTDNDSIETEADLIVDFTESNPFGNY